jgi:ubiquinone/menaquinone biosynthesis C-methylase UbiE
MQTGTLLTRELLGITGPGRFGLLGCEPALARELGMTGSRATMLDDAAELEPAFDTLVLGAPALAQHARDPLALFRRLHRAQARYVALLPAALRGELAQLGALASHQHWATAAVQEGFRRSVAGFRVADYAAANDPLLPPLLVLERIDTALLARWPIERLLQDRDLHMDMTREIGPRADAHLVRYALAAQWVRAGDTVLDCACGLGYGTGLLAAQSKGARFIGVDIDAGSADYGAANFGAYGAEYRAADAARLDFLPDASVDVIVSFETIEHVTDYGALMDEFARVLKPDGRIVASVPNLWVDETGRDPNPHHFHAFDWDRFAAAFGDRFLIERRYRQEAPSGFKLIHAQRNLQEVSLGLPSAALDDTEWWIVVASADPRRGAKAGYRHPDFDAATAAGARVADFGAHYDNPWLYRTLVQMGERLTDPGQLRALALDVLANSRNDSADVGAAATVLAYGLLASEERFDFAGDVFSIADAYGSTPTRNPHVLRWQISLAYAAALLALSVGDRERACAYFDSVAGADALAFSPLLATKTVAAGYWRAVLALVDGEPVLARAALTRAIAAARGALHADDLEAIGNPDDPLAFGFSELAEVADMASQCALALKHLDVYAQSPGKFWSFVDVRRFGLSNWAQHVERENRQLMAWLGHLQAALVAAAQPQARAQDARPATIAAAA